MNRRKILASLLAASLCISTAALPASAADPASFEAGNNLVGGVPSAEEESSDFVTYDGHNSNYPLETPKLYTYPTNGGVLLTWDSPTYATKFKVFYRLKGTSKWSSVYCYDRYFTVTGLTNGKAYEFLVLATNGSTWSSYTSKDIVTCTPNTSSNFYTPYLNISPGNSSLYVDWYPSEYAVKSRVFYRLHGTSKWTYKDTDKSEFTITGLTNGKEYDVLVLQSDGKSWTSWTEDDIKIAVPVAGTGVPDFKLSSSNTEISVSWTPVPSAVKYRVFYRPTGTSKWSYKDLSKDDNNTYYNFKGCYYWIGDLKAETKYDVLVLSNNGSKWSSWTNADIKTCTTAKKYTYTEITFYTPHIYCFGENKKITVQWDPVKDAVKYRVFYRLSGTSKWSYKDIAAQSSTDTNKYTITGLINDRQYDLLVLSNNGKAWSEYHLDYDMCTAAPTADFYTPTIFVYTSDASVEISWAGVPNAVKYRIFYRIHGTSKWSTMDTTRTWNTLKGLSNGYKYDFLVLGFDGSKWTTYTKSDILTSPLVAKLDIPEINIYSYPGNPITISWDAVKNATKYRVFYRLHGTSKWTTKDIAVDKNNAYYDCRLTDLTPGKNYDVLVLASDGSSWSKYDEANILTVTKYVG